MPPVGLLRFLILASGVLRKWCGAPWVAPHSRVLPAYGPKFSIENCQQCFLVGGFPFFLLAKFPFYFPFFNSAYLFLAFFLSSLLVLSFLPPLVLGDLRRPPTVFLLEGRSTFYFGLPFFSLDWDFVQAVVCAPSGDEASVGAPPGPRACAGISLFRLLMFRLFFPFTQRLSARSFSLFFLLVQE